MIDIDKYEGHLLINGEFSKQVCTPKEYHATKALLNDAPLLLEEVKRLRERHVAFMQWMIENYDEIVNEWEATE